MCRMISYSNSSAWGALKRRSAVVIVNLTGQWCDLGQTICQTLREIAGDSDFFGNCDSFTGGKFRDAQNWIGCTGINGTEQDGCFGKFVQLTQLCGPCTQTQCQAALVSACSSARSASVGNCYVCADDNERALERAQCTDRSIQAWCSGDAAPAGGATGGQLAGPDIIKMIASVYMDGNKLSKESCARLKAAIPRGQHVRFEC
jgi:hypothetical protein